MSRHSQRSPRASGPSSAAAFLAMASPAYLQPGDVMREVLFAQVDPKEILITASPMLGVLSPEDIAALLDKLPPLLPDELGPLAVPLVEALAPHADLFSVYIIAHLPLASQAAVIRNITPSKVLLQAAASRRCLFLLDHALLRA